MSQVLYQPKPIAHTTSTPNHSNAAGFSSGRPHTSNLASASTIASASFASSRPRRAAALASEATIHAVATSGRRKSSQSSSNKSNSHPSSKATPNTPQKPVIAASIAASEQQQAKKPLQPLNPAPQRVMAALPRSKRPRRGAAPNDEYTTDNSVVMTDAPPPPTLVTNGSSSSTFLSINTLMIQGYTYEEACELQNSSSSSVSKLGNGSGSVREIINGQETEVFVVDSSSPPNAYHHGNGDLNGGTTANVRGKRKAIASPNGAASTAGTSAAATKKRKKEEAAAIATTNVARPVQGWDKAKANNAQYPDNYSSGTAAKGTVSSYRGGYNSNYTYQSPNGTKWTDSVESYRAPVNIDDSEGHYIVREGNLVAGRYEIKNLLGQGTFGKVVRCKDRLRDREVAIKIIRSIQKYTDAAQIEIRVLRALRDRDPDNVNKCIHLIDTFTYHNHVCIVSELLGKSVFDFLKENEFHPFPCKDIWSFAKQLLRSVAFLHELGLVHTDLKPENILLVNNDYNVVPLTKRANSRKKRVLKASEIRLIDFGSATFNEEYHSQIVSTRHYRAPEIILQMGWSFPCDAWSIGCILIEFYTGEALFQTHDNLEHLAMMEMVLGPMPDDFRRKAETYKPGYFYANRLDFPNMTTNKQSRKYVKCMKTIDETINSGPAYVKHDQRFKHLLKRLLTFDPSQRIRVDQALKHSYFDLTENEIP